MLCLPLLVLIGYARATSALAHARALESVDEPSRALAVAACAEAMAATDDAWPLIPVLGIARVAPAASVRAWGQVPVLVDALHSACPAISRASRLLPGSEDTIRGGVFHSVLLAVRDQPAALSTISDQLQRSWQTLASVDTSALAADPRLNRVARGLDSARLQDANIELGLQALNPDRVELLLGGRGPRAWALKVSGSDTSAHAFAVLDDGRLTTIASGQPEVPTVVTVTVDIAGLKALADAVGRVDPEGPAGATAAQAILERIAEASFDDNTRVGAALKSNLDHEHAWIDFDDPVLQDLVRRLGWASS
jgi:hypothetical protein